MSKEHKTSWEKVGQWYDTLVGKEGHFYHRTLVLPGVLKLLKVKPKSRLIDVACGQGVLAHALPAEVEYVGIDIAETLIAAAKDSDVNPLHHYAVGDITQPLPIDPGTFTHAAMILAAQNLSDPLSAFRNAATALKQGGRFVLVLNHPAYRIPRQSSWVIDESKKMQSRKVDRYMTPMEIPIQMQPGKGENSSVTYSYHHPLSAWFGWLQEAGFYMEAIEEWCSDKKSTGATAKMENRAREEFPMFLAISAMKK
jgi:ubiquinone/menaquinone biosynthesis C-methylase UbiE